MGQKPWKNSNLTLQYKFGLWPRIFLAVAFGLILGRYFTLPLLLVVLIATVLWFLALKVPAVFYWFLLIVASTTLGTGLKTTIPTSSKNTAIYVEEVKGDVDNGFVAYVLTKGGRYRLKSSLPLFPGELMIIRGDTRRVKPAKNPGEFCYASYLKRLGLSGTMELSFPWQIVSRKGTLRSSFWEKLYLVREKGRQVLLQLETGHLYSALLLGTNVDDDLRKTASKAGTSHFLVVSGLHIGYMALIVSKLPLIGSYFTVIILLIYACLVGSTPSVWRAVFSYLLAKKYQSRMIDRLGLVLTIMIVLQPAWLFSASFHYSALAVFGIALLEPWEIWSPLKTGLGAWGTVLPLSLYQSGQINFVSLIGNIILGPVVGIMMALALIYLICPWQVLGSGLDYLGNVFITTNNYLSRFSQVVVGFNFLQVLTYWFLWLYFWHQSKIVPCHRLLGKRFVKITLVVAVLISVHFFIEAVRPVELYFLQIADGEASLLRLPYGEGILIDTGSSSEKYDGAERVLNPALRYTGVKKIDTVYLSHRHQDHIGGLQNLLYYDKIMIGNELKSLENKLATKSPVLEAKDQKMPYGVSIKIIDLGQEKGNINDNSLVQLVEIMGWRVLFPGDREIAGLAQLPTIPVHVVKIPHHGSPNAFLKTWMQGTRASLAIFMGGKPGRPNYKVVEKWRQFTGRVCVGKNEGAIRLRFYPQKVQVAIWQNGRFRIKYLLSRD